MAKTQAATTIPPEVFSVSNGIYEEDLLDAVELHNLAGFAVGLCVRLAGQVSGFDGWGTSANEVQTHRVAFATGTGYVTWYSGRCYVDPDVAQLSFRTEVTMPAANTGRVRLTVGAGNVVNTHSAGATTVTTGTLATSATGTGMQTWTLEIEHQTGSSPSCILEQWGFWALPRTSALPDPS